MVKLDHRKRFEMKLGIVLFQSRQQIGEIAERELGVQSACNVEFSGPFLYRFTSNTQAVFDVMRVSVGLPRRAIETAKLAINITDVSRIKVAVYIEEGGATVLPAAHGISQLSQRG
jgi:hypothetical protein